MGLPNLPTQPTTNLPQKRGDYDYLPSEWRVYIFKQCTPAKLQHARDETRGMIGNGLAVITQDDDEGCAILRKTEAAAVLPEACGACFEKYRYQPQFIAGRSLSPRMRSLKCLS
jgi:hypothetical protein